MNIFRDTGTVGARAAAFTGGTVPFHSLLRRGFCFLKNRGKEGEAEKRERRKNGKGGKTGKAEKRERRKKRERKGKAKKASARFLLKYGKSCRYPTAHSLSAG